MGTPLVLCVLCLNQFKATDGSDRLPSIPTMICTNILQQGGEGLPSLLDDLGVLMRVVKADKVLQKMSTSLRSAPAVMAHTRQLVVLLW